MSIVDAHTINRPLCICALSLLGAACFAQQNAIPEASRLEQQGQFKAAAAVLRTSLQDNSLPATQRKNVEFELDRLQRIKKDFPLTRDDLMNQVQAAIKNVTPQEFDRWVAEGRFESREIDGKRYFASNGANNLFFLYPELTARGVARKDSTAIQKARLENCSAIKAAALAEKKPYVLPKRFNVTMTVTAKAGAAPADEMIRAWLPIPRQYPFQDGFQLLSATPPVVHTDDKTSPIRCIFMEQPVKAKGPTLFRIEYEYTTRGVWFDIKAGDVRPCDTNDPALNPFIREAPHVVFTPEMRALSQSIVGSEANPAVKARKCYDWMADNIRYSYALEYSTLRNISDYCRVNKWGDCGQHALLFITLCRLNGVPARWQSGWNTFPGSKNIHDWTEIYLAPYGWVPVDPEIGNWATRYATALSAEQRQQIRAFYFGGLDQYRMSANCDHCQTLNPPKQSLRSDNVDFQRGELEAGNRNIYFDQYSYSLTVKEVKLPPAP